ncbi:RNA-guided endonuclease TnpB family protein [Actinacidiphila sp. ITFR-21]|uniref:RNA-guided endonuclease TnpB family protein n=1 Tax=Actinacidiphila sp. ITFR-21 TaxID=3075199 RepID=UPI00288A09A8|nr:RNA-guided endonuclease TnpB family protein [Streptomyces sp. ITFR-21]WNI19973.1 RNA-guided endonuclease TnpB family protein [Streptomyces sp. ITFR-21]
MEVIRAYRFALDLDPGQVAVMERHAGAARWAYNRAHALMLGQYGVYAERRQAWVEAETGLDAGRLLEERSKAERLELYRRARTALSAENAVLSADLRVVDDHRRRVVHKGRPLLDPGPAPDQGASATAHDLYARRVRLAGLQRSDPAGYAAAKRAELAGVRPLVLQMKRNLVSAGVYRPGAFDVQAMWVADRDRPVDEGGSPWWPQVANGVFACGFARADTAWRNWLSSATGRRAGRRMGLPRFKKKGRAADSFFLPNPNRGAILLPDYRHLLVKGVGLLRLDSPARALLRLLRKDRAEITSVTITRGAHRWYASALATVQQDVPVVWRHHLPAGATAPAYPDAWRDYLDPQAAETAQSVHGGTIRQIGHPTPRQRTAGLVAVDLGSQPLAVLSAPLDPADPASSTIASLKPLNTAQDRLAAAQGALARTRRGSKSRRKAAERVGRIHHRVAQQRATHLHLASKRLATGAHIVAVENLDLVALTASARGTLEEPGRDVAVKSTFNRHLLDAGLGELRRQLAYKTCWYGSVLVLLDKGEPTATKCSKCGERNPSSKPSDQRFTCPSCGLDVSRRINAVRSIHQAARRAVPTSVAPGRGDTQNARRDGNHPRAGNGTGPPSLKRPPTA